MKMYKIIILALLLIGCNSYNTYKIEVVYFNGEKEILYYKLSNTPEFYDGNISVMGQGTIMCGVRKMRILECKK